MKQITLLVTGLLFFTLMACSKSDSELKKPTDPYKEVPSSPVPDQLATGVWFSGTLSAISYYDRHGHEIGSDYEAGREYQFYNEGGKGRIRFWQYLGMRTSSNCVTEIYTRKEGSVVFEGATFTFYPVKGSFKTIKKGCSSGDTTTERPATDEDLKPVVFRWELRDVNGESLLYTFAEHDVHHENPLFVYQFAQP